MNHTEERYGWLAADPAYVSLKHEGDKVIVYERAGLLFVFNFHPTNSFSDYRVGVEAPGKYSVILTSDEKRFGGFDNVRLGGEYLTTPMEWNGRKNWLQVCGLVGVVGCDADRSGTRSRYISRRGRASCSRSRLRRKIRNGRGTVTWKHVERRTARFL